MDHWIWQNDRHFKWWMTILFCVNHETKRFPVGEEVFTCHAGQSFRSIEQWSGLFGCSKKTTESFFEMLKKDQMITRETVGKGNRRKHLLSVVNWEKYQQVETENSLERKPEITQTGNPTLPSNKNDKNEENNKERIIRKKDDPDIGKIQDEFYQTLIPFVSVFGRSTVRDFYNYWSEPNKSKTKIKWQLEKTWDTKRRLLRWSQNNFQKQNQFEKPKQQKPLPVKGLSR